MTVSSTTSRNEYNGNGTTDTFAYTFRILDEDHIAVYVDDVLQTITTAYTVTGVGADGGGDIVFVSPPAVGTANVIFLRAVPLTQETDYVENDPFPAESHEDALDKLTMIVQQQQEQIGRAITFGVTSTESGITFPDPSALDVIRWNSGGTALENATLVELGTVSLPVPVADGGTGAETEADARINLGLEIGVDVQAYDATLLKSADIGVSVQAYDADISTVAASQAEMEAGTEAALRSMSPLRVAQAIAALASAGMQAEVVTFTRDTATASGTQVVTTTFEPTAIIFIQTTGAAGSFSVGFSTGSGSNYVISDAYGITANTWTANNGACLKDNETGANSYLGAVSAKDATSFTITWTKNGSPTGTMNCAALCLK